MYDYVKYDSCSSRPSPASEGSNIQHKLIMTNYIYMDVKNVVGLSQLFSSTYVLSKVSCFFKFYFKYFESELESSSVTEKIYK